MIYKRLCDTEGVIVDKSSALQSQERDAFINLSLFKTVIILHTITVFTVIFILFIYLINAAMVSKRPLLKTLKNLTAPKFLNGRSNSSSHYLLILFQTFLWITKVDFYTVLGVQ